MRTWLVGLGLVWASNAVANEVTLGEPVLLGPRAAGGVTPVLAAAVPAVADCAETRGGVTARFTIAPNGDVTAASIKTSTVTVPEVAGCVLSVVLKLRFPMDKDPQSTVVSVPFVFGGPAEPAPPSPPAPTPPAPPVSAAPPPPPAPPLGPVARAAGTLVVGSVRAGEVEAAVDARLAAIGACLAPLRPAVVGSAVVRFGFDRDGIAQQIVVIDGTADANAAAPCFAAHLGDLRVSPGAGLRAAYVALELAP
jgi:hypothetical protein